jgi:hypothetical protein
LGVNRTSLEPRERGKRGSFYNPSENLLDAATAYDAFLNSMLQGNTIVFLDDTAGESGCQRWDLNSRDPS